MTLEGKVVVLYGAAGSLGGALSRALADERLAGLVLGDLRPETIATPSPEKSCPGVVQAVDVRDQESVTSLAQVAVERFGHVDIVINNAGVLSPNGRLHNLSDADWRLALDVNLMGAVHGVTAAFAVMRSRGGSIINTASVAGLTTWSHAGPYAVTKAAIIQLTKVAALEYAKERIRVNCVCPGVFPSAMHDGLDPSVLTTLGAKHPLGLGTPERLIGAYLYLASDAAAWTTGTALVVDGGYAVH